MMNNDTEMMKEFARLRVVDKLSKAEAYRKAYKRDDMSNAAASKAASRLSKNDELLRMIKNLNDRLDTTAIASKQECMEFLTQVIRTPIEAVGEDSPLAQESITTRDGVRFKMPSKLDAVRELARMAGYYEPERVEVDGCIEQILSGIRCDDLVM